MPQVAIVGFPNAGKSTLFNRLAAPEKFARPFPAGDDPGPGLGALRPRRKTFELVDTGGFFDSKSEPLSAQVKETAWEAAKAADVLVLLLDGKNSLLPAEQDLIAP